MSRLALVFLASGLMLLPAGCSSDPATGYSVASLYPEHVRTVAVPMWDRGPDVYRRDIEFRLTEAIQKRVELDTPYKVVDRSRADTILEGRIVSVDQMVLSFNPLTGNPRGIQIGIAVEFTWTDLRTGEILVQHENFRAAGVYHPTAPFSEDFFEGSADTINHLAVRVVQTLEKSW